MLVNIFLCIYILLLSDIFLSININIISLIYFMSTVLYSAMSNDATGMALWKK